MTYTVYDRSQERGAPVELYEFHYGAREDQIYRYTNSPKLIVNGGFDYTPVPIKRATIKTTGKFEKTQLEIRLPINTPLSDMFLPYPPPQVVRVYVRQMHRTDPDAQAMIVWFGRIISSGREKNEAVLSCDNALLSWKRPGLKRNWQPGCPLLLYGPRCRADADEFKVIFQIVEVSEDGTLLFPENWWGQWSPAKFVRGTIEWDSEFGRESRTILAATAERVRVSGFQRGMKTGTEVTLYLGCRHDLADCRATFDNVNNFGGQPWIPFKNPVKQHPFW